MGQGQVYPLGVWEYQSLELGFESWWICELTSQTEKVLARKQADLPYMGVITEVVGKQVIC